MTGQVISGGQGSGQLQAYDVSSSGAPVALGSPATIGFNARSIAVNAAGTRAYTISLNNTLEAFDLSGGSTPVALGSPAPTADYPYDLALNAAGTRAYVVSQANGRLRIVDVSGSGTPVLLGTATTAALPQSVALNGAGTRAYVANASSSTLQVFSLGEAPTVVGIGSDSSLGTLILSQLADNLGNHTATQHLNLAGYQLVSGGRTGLALTSAGNVGIGTTGPGQKLEVAGNVKISGTDNGLTFPDGSTQNSASVAGNLSGDITSSGTTTPMWCPPPRAAPAP